jgi:hypothetical protein
VENLPWLISALRVLSIASDLHMNKGVLPKFIYFNVVNPRRFKDEADLLAKDVQIAVRSIDQLK